MIPYFKLIPVENNSIFMQLKQQNLCKNVLRAIRASTDLPELSQFPKSHQVTFHYYQGLLYFLEAQYKQVTTKNLFKQVFLGTCSNQNISLFYINIGR